MNLKLDELKESYEYLSNNSTLSELKQKSRIIINYNDCSWISDNKNSDYIFTAKISKQKEEAMKSCFLLKCTDELRGVRK